jgi:hypothetical protein
MRYPKTGVIIAELSTAIALVKKAGGVKRSGVHPQILMSDPMVLLLTWQ